MPVQSCRKGKKPGYKYGSGGKCYTYTSTNEKARKKAKQKAYVQGYAISKRTGEKLE